MDTLIDTRDRATNDTARAHIRRRPPIVNLRPPPLAVRRSVTRLLVDLFARRALIDLGVIADPDGSAYDGSAR